MSGILFVTWNGGGNLRPALGMAAELLRRGRPVRFLGHEAQRTTITALGIRFQPYTHARPWSPTAPQRGLAGAHRAAAMFTDGGPGKDLLITIEQERPELLVLDCFSLGALAATENSDIPRAVLVHTFYEYLQTWRHGPMGLAGLLKGLHPRRYWESAELVLVATLRELDPATRRSLSSAVRHTGPVVHRGCGPARPSLTRDPLVVVSMSTNHLPGQTRALQSILDALAKSPLRVVVTTGSAVDPAQLRVPANAQLFRYLPHPRLLPEASLVICHGGHATTMEALAHDLPLVIMPMHSMFDQPMIGRAVMGAGAGVAISKSSKPARIRAAALRMLGGGCHRHAAARLGANIRELDGAARGADYLTELLPQTTKG